MAGAKGYNEVFERLVDAKDDIEGFIAYGLYKQAKREWITSFIETHNRRPSARELEAFSSHWTPTTLQSLRETAESALSAYAQSVVQDETPTIERDALRLGRPLWKDLVIGVVSAFVYSLLLLLAAGIFHFFGSDVANALAAFAPKP